MRFNIVLAACAALCAAVPAFAQSAPPTDDTPAAASRQAAAVDNSGLTIADINLNALGNSPYTLVVNKSGADIQTLTCVNNGKRYFFVGKGASAKALGNPEMIPASKAAIVNFGKAAATECGVKPIIAHTADGRNLAADGDGENVFSSTRIDVGGDSQ